MTKECKFKDVTVGKNIEDVVISMNGNSPDPSSYQLFDEQTVLVWTHLGNKYNIFMQNFDVKSSVGINVKYTVIL